MEECDICGEDHPTQTCPALGTDVVDIRPISRARATIPYFVRVLDLQDGNVEIVADQNLSAKLNLGTFEAVKTTKAMDIPGSFKLLIYLKDDTQPVWLETDNEDRCNWMCLVSTATTAKEQNVMALQVGMEIIYMTTREIVKGEALKVWYAPHYARKIWRTAETPPFEHLETQLQLSKKNTVMFHPYSSPPKEQRRSTRKPKGITGTKAESVGIFPCTDGGCGLVFPDEQSLVEHQEKHATPTENTAEGFVLVPVEGTPADLPELLGGVQDSDNLMDVETAEDIIRGAVASISTMHPPRNMFVRHKTSDSSGIHKCVHCKATFSSLTELAEHVKKDIMNEAKSNGGTKKRGRPFAYDKIVDTSNEVLRGSRRSGRLRAQGRPKKLDPNFVYEGVKKIDQSRNTKRASKMVEVLSIADSDSETDKTDADMEDSKETSRLSSALQVQEANTRTYEKDKCETDATITAKVDCTMQNREIPSTSAETTPTSVEISSTSCQNGKEINTSECPVQNDVVQPSHPPSDEDPTVVAADDDVLETKVANTAQSMPVNSKGGTATLLQKALPVTKAELATLKLSPKKQGASQGQVEVISTKDKLVTVQPATFDPKSKVPSIMNLDDMDVITGEPLRGDAKPKEKVSKVIRTGSSTGEALLDQSNETYTCKTCGERRRFKGMSELEQHLFTHVGVNKCKKCGKMFNEGSSHKCGSPNGKSPMENDGILVEEMEEKTQITEDGEIEGKGSKGFECKICGREFSKSKYLQAHELRHNSSTYCGTCGKVFTSAIQKRRHHCAKSDEDIKEFFCEFCGANFTRQKYLLAHMATHTEEHKCQKCNKTFARKESLMMHWTKCMPEEVANGTLKVFSCPQCPKVFSKEVTLKNHRKLHNGAFKCSKCQRCFATKFTLDRHEEMCDDKMMGNNPDKLECYECQKTFSTAVYLQRHMAIHTGAFMCVLCNTNFCRKGELRKHTLECSARTQVENLGQISCTVCNETFTDVHAFRVHYESHTHPYKCENCEKLFVRGSALKAHEKKCKPIDKTQSISCNICKRNFASNILLMRHKVVHEIKKYKCNACGKSFRRIDFLNNHMCVNEVGESVRVKRNVKKDEVAPDDPWICPICGKTYATNSNLNKHMLLHGEKKEECHICKKKFHLKVGLKDHMKFVHTDELKVSCEVCGKKMKSRNSLYGHMLLYHSNTDTLYSCECGKSFRLKGNLQKHRLTHSNLKIYNCKFCEQKFKFPEQLRRHELWHTTGPRYYCDLCDKGYVMEFEIKKHLNTVHGGLTYICSYCKMDCHYFHSMKRHLQRRHFDIADWQTDPNEFIRKLATRTKLIATKEADGTLTKPLEEGTYMVERSKKEFFRCGHCQETYKSREEYNMHLVMVHTTARRYCCCYCYTTFKTVGSILQHLEMQHADNDSWRTNTAHFIQSLAVSTSDDMELASVQDGEGIHGSLLAQTLAGTLPMEEAGSDLLGSEQQGLEHMDLQVLLQDAETLKEEDINNVPGFDSTEPVILAEVQGISEDGNPDGTSQTVIIKADGQNIGVNGTLSEELAQALQSLTAQGALGDKGPTMIQIAGPNEGGEQVQMPIQLVQGEQQEAMITGEETVNVAIL